MFSHTATVRLHDTDAAGVLYFAHQFRLAHEAYEAFMEQAGLGIGGLLKKGTLALPIVHAEADFRAPLGVGDSLTISLRLQRLGKTSYTLVSRIVRDGRTVGYVTTTHVALDRRTGRKRELPANFKRAFASLNS
ncbi:MAG TPA: thioesterase family protein [Kiritimatiellia bacterium]|nr:thioesterase family protein [Kiritimatiellia bacterium]